MRRHYMASATSVMVIGILFLCYIADTLTSTVFLRCSGLIVLAMSGFFLMFRFGINRRFRDPSLTLAHMLVATSVILYAMYEAKNSRNVFLVLLLMIFLFGLLHLTTRTLITFASGILLAYGGEILLLFYFKPASLDLRLELLQWATLALSLPWFTAMGALISTLRKRVRINNVELKSMLQQVQTSELNLAEAQHIAGLGGWTYDPQNKVAQWSIETYRLFDIDPAQMAPTGNQFLLLIHTIDRCRYQQLVHRALHEGDGFDDQFQINLADGRTRWLHALAHPVKDEKGRTTLLRGTVMDITERIGQQKALILARDQAALARTNLVDAIESLGDAFSLFDSNDHLNLCNRKYVTSFTNFDCFGDIQGMSFEHLVRLSLDKGEIIEAAFANDAEAWIKERVARHLHPGTEAHELQLRGGIWFQILEQHTPSGGIVGVRRDISEQRQIEQCRKMEYSVTRVLAEAVTLSDAMSQIIETVCTTLCWECGACWNLDQNQLHCVAWWGGADSKVQQFMTLNSAKDDAPGAGSVIRDVLQRGEPVWISDMSNPHMGTAPGSFGTTLAQKAGLQSALAFPIKIGHVTNGVIEFFIRDSRASDPSLLEVMRSIGVQIGQFIVRERAEMEIRHLAFYDPLTCLPNRRLLIDRIEHALAASMRSKRYCTLLFIDLDHFKAINDTLGHAKGDVLLQQVAKRLSNCVRMGDTVARLGGDELVVMLLELSDIFDDAAAQTSVIGEKIRATFDAPFNLGNHVHHSTASIGATLFGGHLEATDEILKRADQAMYKAKKAGRNTLRFFESDLQSGSARRHGSGSSGT